MFNKIKKLIILLRTVRDNSVRQDRMLAELQKTVVKQGEQIVALRKYNETQFRRIGDQNEELLWARVWQDTCRGVEWLRDLPGLSPGRWAVGYNYLYVMTRILNDTRPRSVLDLGLGMSSTLISQYFRHRDDADGTHTIIESDPEWAAFYALSHPLPPVSEIIHVDCVKKQYDGCEYNAFQDLAGAIGDRKYAVISIDAPRGTPKHSRRDILDIIPKALEDSFAIVMDDCERDGEKATIAELETALKNAGIDYCEKVYKGQTYCCVITTPDQKFLCSL